ncbi:MAG: hypothetical protein V4597_01370 [Pseudomonadota bacterium]
MLVEHDDRSGHDPFRKAGKNGLGALVEIAVDVQERGETRQPSPVSIALAPLMGVNVADAAGGQS